MVAKRMHKTTQGVILAAGTGSRLRASGNGRPKCLLRVGGHPLIEHQLNMLHRAGVERICVVVGHHADQVRFVTKRQCTCITNSCYAETNSLYSLWLARNWVRGPFVLLNSDVLAHPWIYLRTVSAGGTALAYDSSSGDEGEQMKVAFVHGRLRSIGKDLPAEEADGENVGIIRFGREAAAMLFDEASALVASGQTACWAPAAVNRIAGCVPIRGVNVAGLLWTEIDFPEDLIDARERVWPGICRSENGGTARAAL